MMSTLSRENKIRQAAIKLSTELVASIGEVECAVRRFTDSYGKH